jgi:ABC-type nickel/cobalt efflux system permease component RcnA
MDVIPLTLALSLVLSLTFIALFVREFSRPRRAGADRDSLLPLEADHPVEVGAPRRAHSHAHDHGHAHEHVDENTCASKRTDGKCCSSCQRRKDRVAAKAAAPSKAEA